MNRIKSTIVVFVAAALLAVPAIGAGAKPPMLNSFTGVCQLKGERSQYDGFFFPSSESATLSGTCTGRANGRGQVRTWKAKLKSAGASPLVEVRARGRGFLKLRGERGRLYFAYTRTADTVLEILGDGSRGLASARERAGAYQVTLVTIDSLRSRR